MSPDSRLTNPSAGPVPIRYRSPEEDSSRWLRFDFRDGDIVISTRSKHGTTWMQMICALLIHRSPALPRPLAELSPWLDWLVLPEDEVFAELRAQGQRRIIKTHTPLDGLPLDDRVSFIVVARNPLDAAVSLYHQGDNIDRQRLSELTGGPDRAPGAERPPLEDWLRSWTTSDATTSDHLDSFNGVFHHLNDAWARRHRDNVVLVHYRDLESDLGAAMQRIANRLGIEIEPEQLGPLVTAAGFDSMRANSEELAPDPAGVLKDRSAFFRNGSSGSGIRVLDDEALSAYYRRAADSAPADLVAWLHRS